MVLGVAMTDTSDRIYGDGSGVYDGDGDGGVYGGYGDGFGAYGYGGGYGDGYDGYGYGDDPQAWAWEEKLPSTGAKK
jgi:hypothetical protein